MISSFLTKEEENDFFKLISSINDRYIPTYEEHKDVIERITTLRTFPSFISESEVFDLIYWTYIYYGVSGSCIFYKIFLLRRIDSSKEKIDKLLDYAQEVLESRKKEYLRMRREQNRVWKHKSNKKRQMDIAIYRLAKDGLTPGEIARKIGFRKLTVVKILEA